MKTSEKLAAAKDFLKAPYAWPGGYEKRLYLEDGETICRDCALENWACIVDGTLHPCRSGWAVMAVDVHWEGPAEHCVQCGKELPSEYGDPEADETDETIED